MRVIPGQNVCIHCTHFIDDLIDSAKQDENNAALLEVQLAEVEVSEEESLQFDSHVSTYTSWPFSTKIIESSDLVKPFLFQNQ